MAEGLEGPDDMITIKRAAELAGIAPNTLQQQALRGKIRTVKPAHDRFTTRRWLHHYLQARASAQGGTPAPLPPDYRTPEGEEPIP